VTVDQGRAPREPGDSIWGRISEELAGTPPDVHALLTTLTQALSRIDAGTWVALVMNPDPATSNMVVFDDAEGAMARYVERLIEAARESGGIPNFGLAQRVIDSGTPIVLSSVPVADLVRGFSPAAESYHATNAPRGAVDAVAVVIVPMRVGATTIGTLGKFDWHHESAPGESEVAWLQAVADRAALALDHARLHLAERRHAERLEAIAGIVQAAGYGQDLRLTLRMIVEQATARFDADAADILLAAAKSNTLVVAARAGFRTSSVERHEIPVDSALSDPNTRPRIRHIADAEPTRQNPRRTMFSIEGFQTRVEVPLRVRDNLIGVLELFKRSMTDWDQQSLDFLETLAGAAAVAIDYTRITASRSGPALPSLGRARRPDLNDLELGIVRLIVEGLTNREISTRLHRSENAIKAQVRRILEKTEAINRTDLAHRAALEGWLEPQA
jgi:DNA-binding CsgD family transcriptional regulator/transcriptional regulator with GAF, ATPase, and Fis domain